MNRFRYSVQADADLDDLTEYFASRNPAAGLRLLDQIESRCRHHARFPTTGRPRPELGAGIRSSTVGSYLVYFRRADDGIVILHVLHGARDIGPDDFSVPE